MSLSDEDLLAECKVQTYRASGRGGQHINVTDSAVRLKHLPTGIVVTCQKERSQYLNKKICLEKLREKIRQLYAVKPKRVPTRPPRAAKEKMLAKKKKIGKKKRLRRPPSQEEKDF